VTPWELYEDVLVCTEFPQMASAFFLLVFEMSRFVITTPGLTIVLLPEELVPTVVHWQT
jgi:hypothetical protein